MQISVASSWRSSLLLVLLLPGCRTDASGPDANSVRDAINVAESPGQACQVVRNLGQDGFLQNYRYDSRGLVSRWDDGFGSYLPQYDAQGALIRAQYVLGDITLASIAYEYVAGKIVKEVWFNGFTGLIDDILVNTWNANGQLTRRESVPFGVFATLQYDALGNAYQVDVLATNGFLLLSTTYTFLSPVKSPDLTLRGLPYGPQFLNYVFNPRRQTSAKAVVSDVNGNRITLFDQDPQKSVLIAGQQQFALFQNFFDKVSGTFYAQTWSYSNCPGNNFPPDIAGTTLLGGSRSAGPSDFALRGSMKDVKQQIEALKRKFRP
ncbi:MAG TPA: hypothetical protein VGQ52_11160 [Gemmatimonadaceae bacterium]|nr:hypothetical protein [Gemmatimonadaceae bacterium]